MMKCTMKYRFDEIYNEIQMIVWNDSDTQVSGKGNGNLLEAS